MGLLTDGMRKYIKAKKKQGYNVSAYNARLIEYAVESLEDLRFIGQEVRRENGFKEADINKIQREIFQAKSLKELLKAILLSEHIDKKTQLEVAKSLVHMLPDIALRLCKEDHQKLALSGHDSYRAALYAIMWA